MDQENRTTKCCHFNMKLFFEGLIISLLFFSCVNQRNLEYMRISKIEPPSYKEAENPEYKLRTDDALFIQISSIDDAATNVFAQEGAPTTIDPYGAYMQAYIIDKEGFIDLPVIGRIKVIGKTTAEVNKMLEDAVTNILSIPNITVKLVNMTISVVGEVNNPGHYVFSQDKLTIYNALSLAGDITVYGNRKKVTIIRTENGMNNRVDLDLTREDILASPYYFIQPNDLIYVKPLRKRFWGMETFPYGMVFTLISTSLLVYTVYLTTQSSSQ